MFSVGNVSQNASRDSGEIPPALIKELEARFHGLRDPFLMYEEDTEFHDAIREMALREASHPAYVCDSSEDDDEDLKSRPGSQGNQPEPQQSKHKKSTRARIRGFLRSVQLHLSNAA